jgi:hypothetical protein
MREVIPIRKPSETCQTHNAAVLLTVTSTIPPTLTVLHLPRFVLDFVSKFSLECCSPLARKLGDPVRQINIAGYVSNDQLNVTKCYLENIDSEKKNE